MCGAGCCQQQIEIARLAVFETALPGAKVAVARNRSGRVPRCLKKGSPYHTLQLNQERIALRNPFGYVSGDGLVSFARVALSGALRLRLYRGKTIRRVPANC